ncbi:hypothetical protein ACLESD_23175 [Pyxidicoccus sp. 3LFB2]
MLDGRRHFRRRELGGPPPEMSLTFNEKDDALFHRTRFDGTRIRIHDGVVETSIDPHRSAVPRDLAGPPVSHGPCGRAGVRDS